MKLELILFVSLTLFSCNNTKSSESVCKIDTTDTIVVSKTIPQEGTNHLYEKEYFVTIENDTSCFSCVFLEHKKTERISIKFEYNNKKYLSSISDSLAVAELDFGYRVPYYKTTYKQQVNELKMILRKSVEDFDLDNLQYMSFELLPTGDLAIEVTNQYMKEFGTKITNNYKRVGQILLNSQLGVDLNKILNRYFISIEQVSIEKLHFVTRDKMFNVSIIKTDFGQIPDKILNCVVYIKLKKH